MKFLSVLIIGSLLLGLIAVQFSGDLLATVNMGGKIGYGIGVSITPWVCALLLSAIKLVFLRLAKRKTAYSKVLKFDVSVFMALSYCVHLGFFSLPAVIS